MSDSLESFRRFVGELGRRRVFRTAALYVIVAVVVVEGTEALVTPLGLPLGTMSIVAWAAILGFPIAVGLAWTFDVTSQGIVRTPPDSEEDRRRRQISAQVGLRLTLTGVAAAAVGATTWAFMEPLIPHPPGQDSSISAEPLPSGEVLVAPVQAGEAVDPAHAGRTTVLLLQRLSGLPGLQPVDPRTAPDLHVDGADLEAAARALGVLRVIEARLESAPGGVVLTADLRDLASGRVEAEASATGPSGELEALVASVVGQIAGSGAAERAGSNY